MSVPTVFKVGNLKIIKHTKPCSVLQTKPMKGKADSLDCGSIIVEVNPVTACEIVPIVEGVVVAVYHPASKTAQLAMVA